MSKGGMEGIKRARRFELKEEKLKFRVLFLPLYVKYTTVNLLNCDS